MPAAEVTTASARVTAPSKLDDQSYDSTPDDHSAYHDTRDELTTVYDFTTVGSEALWAHC